jgi:hypothetical protein
LFQLARNPDQSAVLSIVNLLRSYV